MAHFFLKRAQNETNDSTSLLFCCAFLEKAQKSSLKWKKINFMAGSLDTKLALLLIEEGAAIRLSKDGTDYIFQRNPGLDYFNYRKWRKTEAYGISSEKRNKIYCVQGAADIKLFTRETFTEFVGELPVLSVQQPLGCDYTAKQVRLIKKDIDRLIGCLRQFC